METFGLWIAALLTLGIMSFLYKDNPIYKLCESIFIGISAGYWFVSLFWQSMYPRLYLNIRGAVSTLLHEGRISDDRWLYLVAGILGVMMLLRLVPKIGWISRWPLSFIVGSSAGLYFITYLQSSIMNQIRNTIIPIYVPGNLGISISNLIVFVGVFCGLVYFFFSREHKGAFGGAAKVGIWFLMITFGASFGFTVMSRMSLLIGRIDFLFGTWLGLIR
ncbi:MAG: hypothetical protein MUO78_10105 [candidate division Zixibacteria bacterium]|nr:hypothetical protein [candidate division Zixibacteria bacterium]